MSMQFLRWHICAYEKSVTEQEVCKLDTHVAVLQSHIVPLPKIYLPPDVFSVPTMTVNNDLRNISPISLAGSIRRLTILLRG